MDSLCIKAPNTQYVEGNDDDQVIDKVGGLEQTVYQVIEMVQRRQVQKDNPESFRAGTRSKVDYPEHKQDPESNNRRDRRLTSQGGYKHTDRSKAGNQQEQAQQARAELQQIDRSPQEKWQRH